MFSCLGAEGSKGSLFRNGWLQCFSYLEMGGSNVFLCLGTEGSNGSDRKSTRLNSSHVKRSRMPSSA